MAMPDRADIGRLQELLRRYRRTVQLYEEQQTKFGLLYTPPHVTLGIEDAQKEIQRLKKSLRSWNIRVEDLPIDGILEDPSVSVEFNADIVEPAEDVSSSEPSYDSGGYLLKLPDYQHYYPQAKTQRIIKDILERPGYHLIEAEPGMGKTALISYLWKNQVPIRPAILQLFSKDHGHVSIEKALFALSEQYLGILPSEPNESYQGKDIAEALRGLLRLSSEQGLRVLILIDGIDESDIGERRSLIPQLLPNLSSVDPFNMATIVITTRPDADRNVLAHLPARHPLHDAQRHHLAPFSLEEVEIFVTQVLGIADDGTI